MAIESPILTGFKPVASIFNTARSYEAFLPTSFASKEVLSSK